MNTKMKKPIKKKYKEEEDNYRFRTLNMMVFPLFLDFIYNLIVLL